MDARSESPFENREGSVESRRSRTRSSSTRSRSPKNRSRSGSEHRREEPVEGESHGSAGGDAPAVLDRTRVFIGGVDRYATTQGLAAHLAGFDIDPRDVWIARHPAGFGYIMVDSSRVDDLIATYDRIEFMGKKLTVEVAKNQGPHERRPRGELRPPRPPRAPPVYRRDVRPPRDDRRRARSPYDDGDDRYERSKIRRRELSSDYYSSRDRHDDRGDYRRDHGRYERREDYRKERREGGDDDDYRRDREYRREHRGDYGYERREKDRYNRSTSREHRRDESRHEHRSRSDRYRDEERSRGERDSRRREEREPRV